MQVKKTIFQIIKRLTSILEKGREWEWGWGGNYEGKKTKKLPFGDTENQDESTMAQRKEDMANSNRRP